MPQAKHFLYISSFHTLNNCNTIGKISPILQMRKLKLRKLNMLPKIIHD